MNDFILETPVTWEMVQKALQRHLGTMKTFGPSRAVVQIGIDQGFMAKIALLTLDWEDEKQDFPEKVVVKITGVYQMGDFGKDVYGDNWGPWEDSTKKLHNGEMEFYQNIGDMDILPKYYGGEQFSAENPNGGFFIMEYIPDCIPQSFHIPLRVEVAEEILGKLARISAEYLKNPKKFSKLLENTDLLLHMREEYVKEKVVKDSLETLRQNVPGIDKEIDILLSKLDKLLDIQEYKRLDHFDGRGTLCQGDLWSANILWQMQDGVLVPSKMIDWQDCLIGSPASDLWPLLNMNMNPTVRMENSFRLIRHYHNSLQQELGGDAKVPFTYEELVENYERQHPMLFVFQLCFYPKLLTTFLKDLDEEEAVKRAELINNIFRWTTITSAEFTEKYF